MLRVNTPVVDIWQQVGGQWIFTPMGYISSVDIAAVKIAIDLLAEQYVGINRRRLLDDVLMVSNIVANARNKTMAEAQKKQ